MYAWAKQICQFYDICVLCAGIVLMNKLNTFQTSKSETKLTIQMNNNNKKSGKTGKNVEK